MNKKNIIINIIIILIIDYKSQIFIYDMIFIFDNINLLYIFFF